MSPMPPRRICPECRAVCQPRAAHCWLCGGELGRGAEVAGSSVPSGAVFAWDRQPPGKMDRRPSFQFGLSTLLLMVTFAAIVFSTFKMAPGLGIALVVLAGPALIRVSLRSMAAQASGQPLSASDKAKMAARTTITVVIILAILAVTLVVVAGIALLVICTRHPVP